MAREVDVWSLAIVALVGCMPIAERTERRPKTSEHPYGYVIRAAAACDAEDIARVWKSVPAQVPAADLAAAEQAFRAAESCRQRLLKSMPRRAEAQLSRLGEEARSLYATAAAQPGMYMRATGPQKRTLRFYGEHVNAVTARMIMSDDALIRQMEWHGFSKIEFAYGSIADPTPAFHLSGRDGFSQEDVDELTCTMVDVNDLRDPFEPPASDPPESPMNGPAEDP